MITAGPHMIIKTVQHGVFFYAMFFAFLLGTAIDVSAVEPGNQKRFLVLNSYHDGFKGTDDIVGGFKSKLLALLPDTEIYIEYLDSKHYGGKEFDAKTLDMLLFKYQKQHFDLIFSSDDPAFNILEQHRENLFGTTPIVFCGTNSFDHSRIDGKKGIVGIDERPSFKETLALIFKFHPASRKIVVIHDDSVTGRLNSDEFRRASSGFEDRAEFSYLAGMRLEELVGRVKELPTNSVIVYFASYVESKNGERFSSGKALQMIAAASPVPIYGGWEFNLGKGIVGGRLVSLREHGTFAAELATKILKGEAPESLPGVFPSPNQYMFDYSWLARFRIPGSQLPADSIVINKPPNIIWAHRVEILGTLSGLLLIVLVAIFFRLVISRKDLKLRNSELEKAILSVKQLEGIIPICMYCKNIRNDKESWQQMEAYISEHSEAMFSHGICPDCFELKMSELSHEKGKQK